MLCVRVEDGGSPKKHDESTIMVHVDDVNDNAPYFNTTSAKVDIPENTIVNSFYTVVAFDEDMGMNAHLEYEIAAGTGSDKFSINSSTGSVSTAIKLDREAASSYTITVYAKDKGSPSLKSQPFILVVSVSDANDNAHRLQSLTTMNRYQKDPVLELKSSKCLQPIWISEAMQRLCTALVVEI